MQSQIPSFPEISDIIYAVIKDEATAEQLLIFRRWLESSPENRKLFDKVQSKEFLGRGYEEHQCIDLQRNLELFRRRAGARIRRKRVLRACAAAAVVLMVAGAGTYALLRTDAPSDHPTIATIGLPENKAMVELSDGSVILVDGSQDREAVDNGALLSIRNGEIVYCDTGGENDANVTNRISVPRGAKPHRITLRDGSHVWLNSDSDLNYRVNFSDGERRVILSGEAYFEVARDESAPFVVETAGQSVVVLGTEFNVSAYSGDAETRTTLVRGIVKVSPQGSDSGQTLLPGEQAVLRAGGNSLSVRNIDIGEHISWRNGIISIGKMPLRQVLAKLSRRYDVDFSIPDASAGEVMLDGNIPGEESLDVVLSVLEKVGEVKFEITEKNKIMVKMNK